MPLSARAAPGAGSVLLCSHRGQEVRSPGRSDGRGAIDIYNQTDVTAPKTEVAAAVTQLVPSFPGSLLPSDRQNRGDLRIKIEFDLL